MYLKDLTISGFKSFAKKGELEFASSITAIVGPNGSGKSNVAEAFRFVLGEQSLKSMRGRKGEDLIFNGSEQASRANRAAVSITLNNEKRVFPVDFDEIVLERVVHRDGQNEYSINGSKVRLKDVQEILAAANIGPTGHHIISQGEADRILTASSKERREMIEDALGLKVYQYKKSEAERKLAKTKENIEKVESLRREVAPHLKFLEKQVKKIEQSIKLREELTDKYADYLKREDTFLAFHHDRLELAISEPKQKLKALEADLKQAKATLEAAGKDEKRDQLVAVEEKLSSVRSKRQEITRQVGQLEGQVEFLRRRVTERQNSFKAAAEKQVSISEVERLFSGIEKSVEGAQQASDNNLLKRALLDVLQQLKSFLASQRQSDGAANTEAEEKELADLEQQKQKLETELNQLVEQEGQAETEYDQVKQAIEAESQESREAERAVFQIVSEQKECELKLSQLEHEFRVNERDRDEFKRELQEAVALIGRGAASYQTYQVTENEKALTVEEIVSEDRSKQQERRRMLERLKVRLEELGGANEDIEKEHREVKERDEFLVHEIADLNASVEKLESLISELTEQLNAQFATGIKKIDTEFSRFFTLMFGGGSAALQEVAVSTRKRKSDTDIFSEAEEDLSEEPEEESSGGIDIDVKLPNKRVRGLDMLSGGERALTSIALIFAMSQVNPPLFVILDETDAALDEANSRRYGDMIEALSEKSQLILITHNRETMSRAGILYGVTMAGDGISKLLSVKLEEAVKVAK